MSRFHEDNIAIVTLRMKEFAETEAKKEVIRRLRRIAEMMVDRIDAKFKKGDEHYPEWTANLHDATGVAIYDDGRLEEYLPTFRASGPQQSKGLGEDEWGEEELKNAINEGMTKYSKGLWLVLFSASSYAEAIELKGSPKDRGRNYFTSLWEYLSIDIRKEFEGCIIAPLQGLADVIPF